MNISNMLRLTCASLILFSFSAQAAANSPLQAISIRTGFDSEESVNISSYELVGTFNSPYSYAIGDQYTAELQIETGLGLLSGEGENGVFGRIAPAVKVSKSSSNWSFVLSSGPSIHSEEKYGELDLGGYFEFMSSAGATWEIVPSWEVGYRFQHTSNAHLYDTNPGLDMHVISLAHQF